MKKNKIYIYILAAICIFGIILIPMFCPTLKDDDSLTLMMQGLNILVFLHISYKLSSEDKDKFTNQQKLDNERLNRQLKFELVKKYVDKFDLYLKEMQNIKNFSNIAQFYKQETLKIDELIRRFEQENLRLMNIFTFDEYDGYIYIQSNLIEDFCKFESLVFRIENTKDHRKDDPEILEIDENYMNTLSHISMLTDYLYYILLHDSKGYEMQKKLEIIKRGFDKLKLKNLDKKYSPPKIEL
jgi:hypothetical protein